MLKLFKEATFLSSPGIIGFINFLISYYINSNCILFVLPFVAPKEWVKLMQKSGSIHDWMLDSNLVATKDVDWMRDVCGEVTQSII